MPEHIGFVGLGQMGQPMALNLLHAGFKLRVFDLRDERIAPLVGRGAEPGASPGEVTEREASCSAWCRTIGRSSRWHWARVASCSALAGEAFTSR